MPSKPREWMETLYVLGRISRIVIGHVLLDVVFFMYFKIQLSSRRSPTAEVLFTRFTSDGKDGPNKSFSCAN